MANQWLRLWHDMPTDPKWRTITRISGQPISLVISVYIHLLVDASRNVTRGHADVTPEDLASALDTTEDAILLIFEAMQGRVLDGNKLTGWDKRQVKREDANRSESGAKSSAQRKREQRERQKSNSSVTNVTQCHEASRNVTLDKDKDKNIKTIMSGNPDPDPPIPKKSDAIELLDYLNKKAGRSYRPVKSNIRLLEARMAEGFTPDEIRMVIDRKCSAWGKDEKMRDYLRPETLFGATKFAQYSGETSDRTTEGKEWWQ